MKSTRFNILSQEIPFYSLVFQGYKSLTSSSINLAVDVEKAYLQAVATGMGLQFTLCNNLHEAIKFDEDTAFVSSRYEDWQDRIAEMASESADVLSKVGNQAITSYELKGNVSKTVFANGVTIYVNYADNGNVLCDAEGNPLKDSNGNQMVGMSAADVQELFPEYALGNLEANSFVYQ